MAINANLVTLLEQSLPERTGSVLTFGEQRLLFERPGIKSQRDLFLHLGFESCESLDVSDYEGADHIFDLNEEAAPSKLISAFDMVFTGGTLEHVFHAGRALQHAASFVRPGGTLVHLGPANGWIEHGFFQLSPCFVLDYLAVNRWGIGTSVLIDVISTDPNHWRTLPSNAKGKISGIRQLHFSTATRTEHSTIETVPSQARYSGLSSNAKSASIMLDIVDGEVMDLVPA